MLSTRGSYLPPKDSTLLRCFKCANSSTEELRNHLHHEIIILQTSVNCRFFAVLLSFCIGVFARTRGMFKKLEIKNEGIMDKTCVKDNYDIQASLQLAHILSLRNHEWPSQEAHQLWDEQLGSEWPQIFLYSLTFRWMWKECTLSNTHRHQWSLVSPLTVQHHLPRFLACVYFRSCLLWWIVSLKFCFATVSLTSFLQISSTNT